MSDVTLARRLFGIVTGQLALHDVRCRKTVECWYTGCREKGGAPRDEWKVRGRSVIRTVAFLLFLVYRYFSFTVPMSVLQFQLCYHRNITTATTLSPRLHYYNFPTITPASLSQPYLPRLSSLQQNVKRHSPFDMLSTHLFLESRALFMQHPIERPRQAEKRPGKMKNRRRRCEIRPRPPSVHVADDDAMRGTLSRANVPPGYRVVRDSFVAPSPGIAGTSRSLQDENVFESRKASRLPAGG